MTDLVLRADGHLLGCDGSEGCGCLCPACGSTRGPVDCLCEPEPPGKKLSDNPKVEET